MTKILYKHKGKEYYNGEEVYIDGIRYIVHLAYKCERIIDGEVYKYNTAVLVSGDKIIEISEL